MKLRTTVTGGMGQLLSYYRNGEIQLGVTLPITLPLPNGLPVPTLAVPITSDPFVHEIVVGRNTLNEGPLGSFWRIETRNLQTRTAIGNPIFLKAP